VRARPLVGDLIRHLRNQGDQVDRIDVGVAQIREIPKMVPSGRSAERDTPDLRFTQISALKIVSSRFAPWRLALKPR
jgi:hypothetical protein